jgi:hypothetical protein
MGGVRRRRAYSPRISRSRRFSAVIRSFIFSEREELRVRFLSGTPRGGVEVAWQYAQPCFKPCLHSLIDHRLPRVILSEEEARSGVIKR